MYHTIHPATLTTVHADSACNAYGTMGQQLPVLAQSERLDASGKGAAFLVLHALETVAALSVLA